MMVDAESIGVVIGAAVASGAAVWAKMRFSAGKPVQSKRGEQTDRRRIQDLEQRVGVLEGRWDGINERMLDIKNDVRKILEIVMKGDEK